MKKLTIYLFLIIMTAITCTPSSENSSESSISSEPFGTTPDGTEVTEYTMTNANGIEMKVITYGGIIRTLKVPDKEGNLEDIVLGFDSLEDYVEENPFFGTIVGRYGNRIAGGTFTLDGEEYELAQNNGPNNLHGGPEGFDSKVWEATEVDVEDGVALQLSYLSPHMEMGFPGNLDVVVTYTLLNDNSLEFDYKATTDQATVVNLTQHSYFNLSGETGKILDHELMLNASHFLPVDSTLIPTGELRPVEGTPFDFTEPKVVGEEIDAENTQIEYGMGYDHCWVFDESEEEMPLGATLYEPESGRFMELYTTEPGVQFYSGNFLDGTLTGKDGETIPRRGGLCLETQHYPDSPNQPDFPSVVLEPGEEYHTTTLLKFSTK